MMLSSRYWIIAIEKFLLLILISFSITHGFSTTNRLTTSTSIIVNKINTKIRSTTTLLQLKPNELDSLSLDESKLSDKERERIAMIQKISLEADEMIKNAGIGKSSDSDEYDLDNGIFVEAKDTNWSGQSDVEITRKSTNSYQDLTDRLGLAVGDNLAFLTFAAIGRSNHNEGLDIISVLITALPFMLGWIVVSPLLGAYSRQATASLTSVPLKIIPALSVSTLVGLAGRWVIKGYQPPVVFAILALVFPFILITLWRVLYIKLLGTTSDGEDKDAGAFEVFKMIKTLIKRW